MTIASNGCLTKGRAAVFLDRDGVVIEDMHYLSDVEQVRLIPGVAEAIQRLNTHDRAVVIVTNQSGVARGYFSEQQVEAVHAHLTMILAEAGSRIDGIYYCPHHPMAGIGIYRRECSCRKPSPGMLLQAAQELGLDTERSWMIGDRISDIRAGQTIGCRTILVRTGQGVDVVLAAGETQPTWVVPDLSAAVDALLDADRLATTLSPTGLRRP